MYNAGRKWTFGSGIPAVEVMEHISRETGVSLDFLFLEMVPRDDAQTPLILSKSTTLAAGCRYSVRMMPRRRFGAGIAVEPNAYYYVHPVVDSLVADLRQGKFCALCGPRQSGKSTSVMAAMRQLSFMSEAHIVYLDGLEGAKEKWDSNDLWAYLWDSLHSKCPVFFPDRSSLASSGAQFKSLFLKSRLQMPVTLVLDEADSLLHLSPSCISEFFATVRSLKNDNSAYNLFGFLLVGVETVRDLLESQYHCRVKDALGQGREYMPVSTPSMLSPFPHDHVLTSTRFTLEDVESLLQQAAADRPSVRIDVKEIAASIFQWTGGHKGLSGTCLAYLVQEQLWTFKDWIRRAESYRLGTYIFGLATYSRMLAFVKGQEGISEAHALIFKFLESEGLYYEDCMLVKLRDFIANGVLIANEIEDGKHYVCISTPLLRTALLRGCMITSESQVDPPPSPHILDRKWLILQAVKTMDGQIMCRPECMRAGENGPSEYAHQFLFMCRLKAVLRQAYPFLGAVVLPEVKEVVVPGEKQSLMRLDTLIRDGPSFSKFGAELLANGTLDQIREHILRAITYHDQHSAQVFVINFCMDMADEHIVVPKHDSIIFCSVNFQPSSSSVTVTFVDFTGQRDVFVQQLQHWSGQMCLSGLVP